MQELLLVEDHLLPACADNVVLRRQLDRIHRAGFFAHAAVNAAKLIDLELRRVLFAVVPGRFRRLDVDALGRTDRRAHHARHALHAARFVAVQTVHAAEVAGVLAAVFELEVLAADFRILHHAACPALPPRSEQVTQRRAKTLDDVREVHGLRRIHRLGIEIDDVFRADRHCGCRVAAKRSVVAGRACPADALSGGIREPRVVAGRVAIWVPGTTYLHADGVRRSGGPRSRGGPAEPGFTPGYSLAGLWPGSGPGSACRGRLNAGFPV
jgi:hypothetical protein